MKSIHKILKIIKKEFKKSLKIFKDVGLCDVVRFAVIRRKLTNEEGDSFINYLEQNVSPEKREDDPWYWDRTNTEVRIKWLNEHIKRTKRRL